MEEIWERENRSASFSLSLLLQKFLRYKISPNAIIIINKNFTFLWLASSLAIVIKKRIINASQWLC